MDMRVKVFKRYYSDQQEQHVNDKGKRIILVILLVKHDEN